MGLNVGCIAVKDVPKQAVLEELCLEIIDHMDYSAEGHLLLYGTEMMTNWYVIEYCYPAEVKPSLHRRIKGLSKKWEIILFNYTETAMAGRVENWQGGSLAWSVSHALDRGQDNLDLEGKLPSIFFKIKSAIDRKISKCPEEERCDYYMSIPSGLMCLVTGFSCTRYRKYTDKPIESLRPRQDSMGFYFGRGAAPHLAYTQARNTTGSPFADLTPAEQHARLRTIPVIDLQHLHMDEDALALVDSVIAEDGYSLTAAWWRSNSLKGLNMESEYQATLKTMITVEAKTASDFFFRSMAQRASGNDEQANADLQRAEEIGGNFFLM